MVYRENKDAVRIWCLGYHLFIYKLFAYLKEAIYFHIFKYNNSHVTDAIYSFTFLLTLKCKVSALQTYLINDTD